VSFPLSHDAQRGGRAVGAALCALFFFILVLVAALPGLGQIEEGVRIEGKVRTEGRPLPPTGVMVRLDTEYGERVAEVPINSGGAFEFGGLNRRYYRVTVTAEGFETNQQLLDLGRTRSQVSVEIVLVPARQRKGQAAAPSLSDAQAPKRARKEYAKGVDALAANKLDQARTHLGKAVAEYPCYARAQTDLAMVLSEQQKLAEAEAAVRKASACDPGFTESYLQLGLILNQEKKFAESEAALEEGVRQAPGQWRFHYELAAAHYGEKQFAKAEQDYQRVLSLNATPPAELRVKLGNVYLDEHRFDKAYEQMQEYLKAEPEGPLAEKIKKVMQKMRASGVVRP